MFLNRDLFLPKLPYTILHYMDAIIQHSDLHGIEGFKRQFDINRFTGFYKNGIITRHEYEELNRSYENFVHSPDAHAMMVFLMACGTKPI